MGIDARSLTPNGSGAIHQRLSVGYNERKHQIQRKGDDTIMDHERDKDIPEGLKWALAVYNRAGFPTLAFLLIVYICFVTLRNQTEAIEQFKQVMVQLKQSVDLNTSSVERMTSALYRTRN